VYYYYLVLVLFLPYYTALNSNIRPTELKQHILSAAYTFCQSDIGYRCVSKQTFEDSKSDILRNEYFQPGAELVTHFALEYRRLGESADQKHVLEI